MPKKSKKSKVDRRRMAAPLDEKERKRDLKKVLQEIDERYAEVFRRLAKN